MSEQQILERVQEEINSLITQSSLLTDKGSEEGEASGCDNCHNPEIKVVGGTYVCLNCYSQLGNLVDESGEWKNYNNDSGNQGNPRCSLQINPFLPETSCATFIRSSDNSYSQRYRQMTSWQIPHYEKSLKHRLDDIKYFGQLNNLPGNAVEFAQQLYVEFIRLQPLHKKKKSSRGDCHTGIIAVCISLACKEFRLPRSPDEICQQIGIENVDFTKADNLFFSVMQHSKLIDIANNHYVIKSSDYINSFCRVMGIDDRETIDEIVRIEQKVSDLKILQKNTPQAIACGCIYFVAKMKNVRLNKSDFDQKCNVSIPTLTKVYDRLIEYTNELI
jgi:transcription initiation factor TFIIIB Brf1 subunit/transcription initiation factor TFIIB